MKKFYLALSSVLFFSPYSWADFEGFQASWKGDLKIKDKIYSCEGEKEISQFASFSFNEDVKKNLGLNKTLALCLSDKNQALWLISTYTETKIDYDSEKNELVDISGTDYYENCQFVVSEEEKKSGWDCEKTEVLSEEENLLSKIELENKKEIDPTDPYAVDEVNRRTWFKGKNQEENQVSDECGCDEEEIKTITSEQKPKTNEPKEILEIKQIYRETKELIPNRDSLITNYEGKILVEGTPISLKTSHKAYFAKNTKRIIFVESSFKGGNGVNSFTEYLFDKGNLIFAKKMPKGEENKANLCYYKGEKVIYRQGEFATTEECSRLRKKGEEIKNSVSSLI